MEYHTPGLALGCILSLASLLLLILLFFVGRPLCRFLRRQKIRRTARERANARKLAASKDAQPADAPPQSDSDKSGTIEENTKPEDEISGNTDGTKDLTDDEIQEILLEDEDFLDVPIGDEQKNE